MPKKKFAPDKEHGYIGDKPTYTVKKPPYDAVWEREYWLLRDREIYKTCDEESKQQIKERYKV